MLTIKFRLTEEEYFQFSYYSTWSAPERRGYRIRYFLRVLVLYAGVALLYLLTNRENQRLVNFIVFGSIGVVYFLLVPTMIRKSVRRRVREILRQEENQHVLDESEIELSEQGIVDRDKVSESRYAWDAIVRKAETEQCVYLYTNSYHAIVIPKRALKDLRERQDFEHLLNRHLSLSSEF